MSNQNGDLRDLVADAAAAEVVEVLNEDEPETLVVTFARRRDAEAALLVINKALRKRHDTIYQGALVSRNEDDDELQIFDLHDMGLGELIGGGVNLFFDTGRDGFRLLWSTVGAGLFFFGGSWRLVRSTARRSLALLGSTWSIPRRRRLDSFGTQGRVEPTGVEIEPGGSAVVLVADHETAVELANELVINGGEII